MVPQEPTPLKAFTTVDNSCINEANGVIELLLEGEESDLLIQWSTGEVNKTRIDDLASGDYYVTLTSESGCQQVERFKITSGDLIQVTSNLDPSINELVICEGEEAIITLSPTNGNSEYEYLWSNGDESSTLSTFEDGIYNCIISDENGCEIEYEVTVSIISEPTFNFYLIDSEEGSILYAIYDESYQGNWLDGNTSIQKYVIPDTWYYYYIEKDGCLFEFDFFTGITSTDNQLTSTDNQLLIFPNPANDFITINENYSKYWIFNSHGDISMKGNQASEIDISSLTAGVYIIKIKTESKNLNYGRFIKLE